MSLFLPTHHQLMLSLLSITISYIFPLYLWLFLQVIFIYKLFLHKLIYSKLSNSTFFFLVCTLFIMKRVISLFCALAIYISLTLAQADPKKDKLTSLINQEGIIKLNSNTYDRFTEGKRNYGMVVLLTALSPQFNCHPCR